MSVQGVHQNRLSDFGAVSAQSYCPVCTSTQPREQGYRDPELLKHIYIEDDLTYEKVADLYDVSSSTIKNWLRRHDIQKSRFTYEMPEQELRRLYVEEEQSIEDISDHYGCSFLAVRNRLQVYGIDIRGPGDALVDADSSAYRDEDQLRRLYKEEGLSKHDIAERCGVAESTVQYWMDRFGIESRDYSAAQIQRRENQGAPFHDEDTLRELYWEDGLTQREIAEELDCGFLTVQRWMDRFDIKVRHGGAHGKSYETDRGEYVRSSPERQIANWLHQHDIEYTYEPEINADLVPDFLVDGVYIEYWGMVGREEYLARMQEKQARYKSLDVKLIELFQEDLDNLGSLLDRFV